MYSLCQATVIPFVVFINNTFHLLIYSTVYNIGGKKMFLSIKSNNADAVIIFLHFSWVQRCKYSYASFHSDHFVAFISC